MPRGRQRGALPLAPGSVRFLAGVLLGQRAGRPAGPGVTSPATASGADRGDVGPVGSYCPLIYVTPLASRSTTPVPTSPSTPVPYRSSTAGPAPGTHGRSGAPLQRARRR